jgi:hypothetical protein
MWALYRQLVAPLAAPAPVQHLVPRHLQMSRWALLRAGWGWLLATARRRKAA